MSNESDNWKEAQAILEPILEEKKEKTNFDTIADVMADVAKSLPELWAERAKKIGGLFGNINKKAKK